MVFAVVFSAAVVALTVFYVSLIGWFARGWSRVRQMNAPVKGSSALSFSIIIAARNEAGNISRCVERIISQFYPADQFEIIVVDDHSEDDTAQIVKSLSDKHTANQLCLLSLSAAAGKKKAIEAGIAAAKYDWIITTDADCTMGPNWLATIAGYLEHNDAMLLSAPVQFDYNNSFFQKAQALEFMGLIGIGAASIANGKPNLCNGANLIYKKQAFFEVEGFRGVDHISSGDDEFLMHKIAKRWPGKVHFLAEREAIVSTPPNFTLGQFMQQRKRWVSKSRQYENKGITSVLVASYLFHLCMLAALISSLFNPYYFILFVLAFVAKLLAEYIFLKKVAVFFNRQKLLLLLIPSAFLYMLYVVFIGIYGNFGKYRWKGRTVS
jgi:cellulose synthase/poly-beta-1,6-N-acetylglucosamine synthase-like glycosyltransferase